MAFDKQRPDIALYSFIAEKEVSASRPLILPPEEQKLFAQLAIGSLFPLMRTLGDKVRTKGEPGGPIKSWWQKDEDYKPGLYYFDVLDRGPNGEDWFNSGIHTYTHPEPLDVQGSRLGNVVSRLYLSNHINIVSFGSLNTGQTTCANDDIEGSDRILNTTESIFEPLPSIIHEAGNPALWLARLVRRHIFIKMEEHLAQLPELR
jgi:hypothetical protein